VRESKGLTQKQVAERVSTFYSDDSAYRRIERGTRLPEREAAIAIVGQGLLVTDVQQINGLIALAGYSPLSVQELQDIQRGQAAVSGPAATVSKRDRFWTSIASSNRFPAAVGLSLSGAILICVLLNSRLPDPVVGFSACLLYAALYPVSILLESSHGQYGREVDAAAVGTFCLVLLTSAIALTLDYGLAQSGNIAGLALGLGLFVSAAVVQWLATRSALPDTAIVAASFQTRTAQAAHLKNTGYFVAVVVLFWLPPYHAIVVLRHQVQWGETEAVRNFQSRYFLASRGLLAPSPGVLWIALALLLLLSIPMGAKLLDRLTPHQRLNRYSILLYIRTFLYFLLSLTCLGWYSYAFGSLIP
jgi:transcriptional regulator with XRE-family HTH domain